MEKPGMNVSHLVDKSELEKHVKFLSELERLSGEPEAEEAVTYIINQLKQYGVSYERYQFDGYFSDPHYGEVLVNSQIPYTLRAKARSFSRNCPNGITSKLVYDKSSDRKGESCIVDFKGKIVISWNYLEDYVMQIEKAGALGLIHIWPSEEEAIHEETVGTIWGTPTIENMDQLTKLPVVGVNYHDGIRLLEELADKEINVTIKTGLKEGIKTVSLPVGTIKGEEEEFLLISSHYDSWHKGATDNAVGNALLLELARLFSISNSRLKRGIKFAWWPGHSNGRYAGSAWYCDHFWEDLNERCVAHINVDFPGSKGNEAIFPRSTSMEDKHLLKEIIKTYTGKKPEQLTYLPRGADQSFWGPNIPIHIMFKYEPASENKIYQTPGGNWWWHTEKDLFDKVDFDLLVRDTKIHSSLVNKLSNCGVLPIRLDEFLSSSRNILEQIDSLSDKEFDFAPIYGSLEVLMSKVKKLHEKENHNEKRLNELLKKVSGTLNRLMFSYSSRYEYDNTFPFHPFPGLAKVKGVYHKNTTPEIFIFACTYFVRQRNRFVQEVKGICREIDLYI
ncbi:M28 family peptidase [Cytobacillus sp.]|uniref:M28 family peptidase n=1 Tax=Cytobacillus sp. TaxID=2675269 RepID=UPI0035129A06